jgi:hypothetical protein
MATLQEHRLGYYSQADLEQGTSGFSTLRIMINHYLLGEGTVDSTKDLERCCPATMFKGLRV